MIASSVEKLNTVCVANAIIIYSWNEHDEGGWLVPTRTSSGEPGRVMVRVLDVHLQCSEDKDAMPYNEDRPPRGYSIPIIDLDGQTERQVVVDREEGQYLGHVTTVLIEDDRAMSSR